MTLEEWIAELKLLAGERCEYDAECWRCYFEAGMTPQEALDEDMSYA